MSHNIDLPPESKSWENDWERYWRYAGELTVAIDGVPSDLTAFANSEFTRLGQKLKDSTADEITESFEVLLRSEDKVVLEAGRWLSEEVWQTNTEQVLDLWDNLISRDVYAYGRQILDVLVAAINSGAGLESSMPEKVPDDIARYREPISRVIGNAVIKYSTS